MLWKGDTHIFQLVAQRDNPVGRQSEKLHGTLGIADHPGDELFPSDRHIWST